METLLLNVKQVARLLGCSERQVYRLADAGRMPRPQKLARSNRWDRRTLERWIDEGMPAVERRGPWTAS